MDASKRIVNLTFAAGTLMAYIVLSRAFESLFAVIGFRDTHLLGEAFKNSDLAGAVAALVTLVWAWKHARVRPMSFEVADELNKVTWPTWKETKTNTRVTVVVTIVVALILWVFDMVFGNLTSLILGSAT